MSVIHRTTMTPNKLELLAAWLPTQPWYAGAGEPQLTKAGGFRLDDPAGEVGIEMMVVTDASGDTEVTYHAPLTYRGAPADGVGHALIGTAEHGVLGKRWIYDGIHDPVLVAELIALISGAAQAQAQNVSGTPDTSVHASYTGTGTLTALNAAVTANGPDGSDLTVDTAEGGQVLLRINRVLHPGPGVKALGSIDATWTRPDTTETHGRFVSVLPLH